MGGQDSREAKNQRRKPHQRNTEIARSSGEDQERRRGFENRNHRCNQNKRWGERNARGKLTAKTARCIGIRDPAGCGDGEAAGVLWEREGGGEADDFALV